MTIPAVDGLSLVLGGLEVRGVQAVRDGQRGHDIFSSSQLLDIPESIMRAARIARVGLVIMSTRAVFRSSVDVNNQHPANNETIPAPATVYEQLIMLRSNRIGLGPIIPSCCPAQSASRTCETESRRIRGSRCERKVMKAVTHDLCGRSDPPPAICSSHNRYSDNLERRIHVSQPRRCDVRVGTNIAMLSGEGKMAGRVVRRLR